MIHPNRSFALKISCKQVYPFSGHCSPGKLALYPRLSPVLKLFGRTKGISNKGGCPVYRKYKHREEDSMPKAGRSNACNKVVVRRAGFVDKTAKPSIIRVWWGATIAQLCSGRPVNGFLDFSAELVIVFKQTIDELDQIGRFQ